MNILALHIFTSYQLSSQQLFPLETLPPQGAPAILIIFLHSLSFMVGTLCL